MTETCPVCESPHDTADGLMQHIVMRNDHDADTRFAAACRILVGKDADPAEYVTRNGGDETAGETASDDTSRADESDDGDDPSMQAPTVDREPEADTSESDHPAWVHEGCPECGHELADVRDDDEVSVRGGGTRSIPEKVGYICPGCGQGWPHE